jgi:hypothetical protein
MLLFTINFLLAGVILLVFWIVSKDICWREALTQLGTQTLLILAVCLMIKNSSLSDYEIISGRIVSKDNARVSCRHSYQCRCTRVCSGSGKSRTCYRVCQTCYEHSYDVDWFADTNIGRRVYINKVDRQGVLEPDRWTKVKIGEPASFTHSYQNYIKADPDSLFQHHMDEKDIKKYPAYPDKVYDYYRINRGVGKFNLEKEISEINADIGPAVGGSLVIVTTEEPNPYPKLIQRAWMGAKKNDIVLVLRVDDSGFIKGSEVVGIAYPDFKVRLRNVVNDHGRLDQELLDSVKQAILKDYKRRPMSEFEYLKESYKPTVGEWIFSLIVSLVTSIGLGIFFHKNEVFGNNRRYRFR